MQKYQNNVISPTGQALANVSVLVNTYPQGIKANIFSDNGVTPATNPLTTDANGAFSFYADDGHYSLVISGPNVQTITLTDIVLADEIPSDNIPATTVHDTDVLTVQQGTELRAATVDQIRNAILGDTPVAVTQGGTGQTSLTQHAVLLGDGTDPIGLVPVGTAGQVLTSGGSAADPAFADPAIPPGTLIGIQRLTSSATYTPTPGTNSVFVVVVAGGGAGGGAQATVAGACSIGGGGNSGSYGSGHITSGFSGVSVTVGAGGIGVSGGSGGNGGSSSFGSAITTVGGSGNGAGTAVVPPSIAGIQPASSGSGGNVVNASGNPGSPGVSLSTGAFIGGNGAHGPFGGAGTGQINNTGTAATGPGSGGGGASNGPSSAARAGANGSAGIVIIFEYS